MNKEAPKQKVYYSQVGPYHFDTAKPIGRGSFGKVCLAFNKDGKKFAVKILPLTGPVEEAIIKNTIREVEILRQTKSEHIVKTVDILQSRSNLYIFMEHCDGSLEDELKRNRKFSKKEALSIIKQIACAFISVEDSDLTDSNGKKIVIMHRDIKPDNILIRDGKIKVGDFGLSKNVYDDEKNKKDKHTYLGSPLYSSPQLLNYEKYSAKCDVWSTGMVLYRLLFGGTPWGTRIHNLYDDIKAKPLMFPKDFGREVEDLVRRMLQAEEENRLSWREVYEHPALQDL